MKTPNNHYTFDGYGPIQVYRAAYNGGPTPTSFYTPTIQEQIVEHAKMLYELCPENEALRIQLAALILGAKE